MTSETNSANVEKIRVIKDGSSKPPPFLFSKRFLVVILILISCINMYALRANISITILEMTSNKTITRGNQTIHQSAEYNWDSQIKGLIISLFGYGFLGSIFGGSITSTFGGATTFGVCLFLVGAMTISTPIILKLHLYLFMTSRVLIGFFECIAYVSVSDIFSQWTPVKERSSMVSYSMNGIYIGTAVAYPFCGFIAQKWGWPIVFYITGSITCTSAIIWLISVKDSPTKDSWISTKERNYLLQEVGNISSNKEQKIKPSWRKILGSKSVWALCTSKCAYGVGFSLLVACFPLYVKDMTGETIDKIGFISAIPNIICIIVIPIGGKLIDYVRSNSNMTITMIHKIIMCTGFLVSSFLFLVAVCMTNFIVSMVCFVLIKLFLAINFLNNHLVCLSLAPKHTSTLAGLTAMWYTVASIFTPTLVGYIVRHHSVEEWNKCFIITSLILIVGALLFLMFGSSEPQSWAKSSIAVDENERYQLKNQN